MASSPFPPPIQTDSPHRKTFQMLLLTFPKQGGQPGWQGCVSVCECACRGGGGHGRTPAWPGAGRKEARYSWAGAGSPGEFRYAASQRHTEPSLCCEFQSPGWWSQAVPPQPLPPGQMTLSKSLTHSGPHWPPLSGGSTPCSSKCGPCTSRGSMAGSW